MRTRDTEGSRRLAAGEPASLVAELRALPTLCVGQCCSLKVETNTERTWLCRVAGGVTVERRNDNGDWRVYEGGCGVERES